MNNEDIINYAQSLSGTELQELIIELAKIRAKAHPSVPEDLPDPRTLCTDPEHPFYHDNPVMYVALFEQGAMQYFICSPGLGWLRIDLPKGKAFELRDGLNNADWDKAASFH